MKARLMILKLATNHQYTAFALKKLHPYLEKPITLQELVKIPVDMAIVSAESSDECITIDHPQAF